jgi:hypothetical protein
MYYYETHMHTSEVSSCAGSSAEEQVYSYKKRGYTGVIITDHFINGNSTCPKGLPWDRKMKHFVSGYVKAKEAGEKYGLDVFLGWEFTIRGSDFLTYGLDVDFLIKNPNLDKLAIEDYSMLVRDSGGYLAQAHPFRDEWYIEHKRPVEPSLLDGVEIHNSMDSGKNNAKARELAKQHDLPVQAGSDSHNIFHSRYSGIKLGSKADSIFDIINAIKTSAVGLI